MLYWYLSIYIKDKYICMYVCMYVCITECWSLVYNITSNQFQFHFDYLGGVIYLIYFCLYFARNLYWNKIGNECNSPPPSCLNNLQIYIAILEFSLLYVFVFPTVCVWLLRVIHLRWVIFDITLLVCQICDMPTKRIVNGSYTLEEWFLTLTQKVRLLRNICIASYDKVFSTPISFC